jgi:GH15 family glucan-1,4-alpha-glucosidase
MNARVEPASPAAPSAPSAPASRSAPAGARASGPLDDYAAIGDCKSIALVSRRGSIDWLCLPHFSGPSLFGALLDDARGGRFAITPLDVLEATQAYEEDSNVVVTRFRCRGGTLELTDGMALGAASDGDAEFVPAHELFRSARCVEGEVEIEAEFQPRPFYARGVPRILPRGRLGWVCRLGDVDVHLLTDLALRPQGCATLRARERLRAGEARQASLTSSEHDLAVLMPLGAALERRIAATNAWWRGWCDRCAIDGRWREVVRRSALTLKLLTYCLSGAVVAAGTTSVPVSDDGRRNWDYRFCWLRDTSLALRAFMDLGHVEESRAFLAWLLHATRLTRPRLQVVYDVFGEARLRERELPRLAGFRGIGPVRIGNGAHDQKQLDVYGELLVTACDYVERGGALDRTEMELLAGFAGIAQAQWREPDQGIWEIRLAPRHNTHSKLMCWAAFDRALKLHERVGLPIDPVRIAAERDAVRADIDARGFDAELGGYVGWYGGDSADASLQLMLRLGYLGPDDPRMRGTIALIERQLERDGGLLYRYPRGRPPTASEAAKGCSRCAASGASRRSSRKGASTRRNRSSNDWWRCATRSASTPRSSRPAPWRCAAISRRPSATSA